MTLPRYEGNYSRCVKCGQHGEHFTRYRAANPSSWDPGNPSWDAAIATQLSAEEHLERECRNCGYSWAEACMEPRP